MNNWKYLLMWKIELYGETHYEWAYTLESILESEKVAKRRGAQTRVYELREL